MARVVSSVRHDATEENSFPIDWDAVIRFSHHHGTLPLVYRAMKQLLEINGLDPDSTQLAAEFRFAYKQLKFHYMKNAALNFRRAEALKRIIRRCEARHIPVVSLKGVYLAHRYYGSMALRQFTDLDFWVPREHMEEFRRILLEMGYLQYCPPSGLSEKLRRFYLGLGEYWGFRNPDQTVSVDVKTVLLSHYHLSSSQSEKLFQRHRLMDFDNQKIRLLSKEDDLIVLCLHGMHHAWSRLALVCDVAFLLTRPPAIDWDIVRRTAVDFGLTRALATGVLLAEKIFDTHVPEEIRNWISRDPHAGELAEISLWTLTGDARGRLSIIRSLKYEFRSREHLRDRLRFIFRQVVIPTNQEFSRFRVPDILAPLYYFLRMYGVAEKLVLNILNRRSSPGLNSVSRRK